MQKSLKSDNFRAPGNRFRGRNLSKRQKSIHIHNKIQIIIDSQILLSIFVFYKQKSMGNKATTIDQQIQIDLPYKK